MDCRRGSSPFRPVHAPAERLAGQACGSSGGRIISSVFWRSRAARTLKLLPFRTSSGTSGGGFQSDCAARYDELRVNLSEPDASRRQNATLRFQNLEPASGLAASASSTSSSSVGASSTPPVASVPHNCALKPQAAPVQSSGTVVPHNTSPRGGARSSSGGAGLASDAVSSSLVPHIRQRFADIVPTGGDARAEQRPSTTFFRRVGGRCVWRRSRRAADFLLARGRRDGYKLL